MLLEDEYGTINLIVPPAVYERHRLIVRTEPLMLAEGRLERLRRPEARSTCWSTSVGSIAAPDRLLAEVKDFSMLEEPSAPRARGAAAGRGGRGEDFRAVAPAGDELRVRGGGGDGSPRPRHAIRRRTVWCAPGACRAAFIAFWVVVGLGRVLRRGRAAVRAARRDAASAGCRARAGRSGSFCSSCVVHRLRGRRSRRRSSPATSANASEQVGGIKLTAAEKRGRDAVRRALRACATRCPPPTPTARSARTSTSSGLPQRSCCARSTTAASRSPPPSDPQNCLGQGTAARHAGARKWCRFVDAPPNGALSVRRRRGRPGAQ